MKTVCSKICAFVLPILLLPACSSSDSTSHSTAASTAADSAVARADEHVTLRGTCPGLFHLFGDLEQPFECSVEGSTIGRKAAELLRQLRPDGVPEKKEGLDRLWIVDAIWYRDARFVSGIIDVSEDESRRVMNVPFGMQAIAPPNGESSLLFDSPGRHLSLLGIAAPDIKSFAGKPIVVAVIDSGVMAEHELLRNVFRKSASPTRDWYDGIGSSTKPVDESSWGHGTAVASLISGYRRDDDDRPVVSGAAPNSRLIACRAWKGQGKVCDGTLRSFLACLQWSLAPGGDPLSAPDIVNISGSFDSLEDREARMIVRAIEVLDCAGITVVSSAGNGGSVGDHGPACRSIRYPPQTLARVISVGALANEADLLSASSRGPAPWARQKKTIKPDLVAPGWGENVLAAGNENDKQTVFFWQTSAAAPLVSGVVAAWLDACPGMQARPGEIRTSLRCRAHALRGSVEDCECTDCSRERGCPDRLANGTFGYGYPDLQALIRENCPSSSSASE